MKIQTLAMTAIQTVGYTPVVTQSVDSPATDIVSVRWLGNVRANTSPVSVTR